MIGNLSHLHDQSEDVGIVVEQNTLGDIGLELAGSAVHNTAGKVIFLLAEELTVNIDLLGRKLHGRRVITLDATKHETASEDSKLAEGLLTRTCITECLNWVEELLVKDGNMAHAVVVAASALVVLIHLPIQSRTRALLAEVAGKWTDVKESDQGEELANAILQWGSGQAPFMISLEGKASLGRAGRSSLYAVSIARDL